MIEYILFQSNSVLSWPLDCKVFGEKVSVQFDHFIPNAKHDLQSVINNEKQNDKTRRKWKAAITQCSVKCIFMSETFPKCRMQNKKTQSNTFVPLISDVDKWLKAWRSKHHDSVIQLAFSLFLKEMLQLQRLFSCSTRRRITMFQLPQESLPLEFSTWELFQ